jgi:outer membrane protein OmpA-like peptidoglycan-associated protein
MIKSCVSRIFLLTASLSFSAEIYPMAKMLLCCLASFLLVSGFSQNLVANTGFEERNICVEYGVKCAPEAWFFLPRYARMAPVEPDSNHYELLMMGDPRKPVSVGNFIYTKLLCPLVAGEEYQVKLRVHTRGVEFDYLDVWTGPTEPWKGRYSFSRIKPAFTILPENLQGENLKSWREVTYTFKAVGGERFFLLGNISQKELTRGRKKTKRKAVVEYGVDDISLFATNLNLPQCAEYEAIKDQVYRNDFRHPGKWVENVELDSTLITGYKKRDTSTIVEPPVVITTPPRTDTLIIPDVLFKFDKSDLNPKFSNRLDSFVTAINSKTYNKLLVAGHTDNYGTDEYNIKLSQDRAHTIRLYLLDKLKIKEELIEARGYGESQPRATNATVAGRQLNRRVEIIIYY